MADDIVTFLRRRDYRMVRELGRGGCGRTVLLHDDAIDEQFVCKKYDPSSEELREQLFDNFVNEIKLIHGVYHPNLVRVFNYHLLPESKIGYIVMEYVAGAAIDVFLGENPKNLRSVFRQVVSAFEHLGGRGILHRDIRPQNILVSSEGSVKVIDLGFGKRIFTAKDFEKSITLNWAFTPPDEFLRSRYDYRSEVYFVGKLFQEIMTRNSLADEKVGPIVRKMISEAPWDRYAGFADVAKALARSSFSEDLFGGDDLSVYRRFADQLCSSIAEMEVKAAFRLDAQIVIDRLQRAYQYCMLEVEVGGSEIARCFIDGPFRVFTERKIDVDALRSFASLFERLDDPRRLIVLSNLYSRLDRIERYDKDAIPF